MLQMMVLSKQASLTAVASCVGIVGDQTPAHLSINRMQAAGMLCMILRGLKDRTDEATIVQMYRNSAATFDRILPEVWPYCVLDCHPPDSCHISWRRICAPAAARVQQFWPSLSCILHLARSAPAEGEFQETNVLWMEKKLSLVCCNCSPDGSACGV